MYRVSEGADSAFGGECPGSVPEEDQKEYALSLLKTGSFSCKPDTRGKARVETMATNSIRSSQDRRLSGKLQEPFTRSADRLCYMQRL